MSIGVVKFNADLAGIAAQIDVALATVVKKVTVEAFNSITELTPVDTGRARASWDVSLGAPSDFLPPDVSPETRAERKKNKKPKKIEPTMAAAASAQEGKAFDAIALIDAKQPVFIVSNLPYIEALEEGHSKQAPAGMVRLTVAALEIGLEKFLP